MHEGPNIKAVVDVLAYLEKTTRDDDSSTTTPTPHATITATAVGSAGPPPPSWIKAAFESIRDRELAWLRGLSIEDQKRLDEGGSSHSFVAHHLTMSGEFGLCLLGLKPCVAVTHGMWDVTNTPPTTSTSSRGNSKRSGGGSEQDGRVRTFASEHRKHVLDPWVAEFSPERYGFLLTTLTSAAAPSVDIPAHPGFKGASLFYNTNDPSARLVKSVFLSNKDRVPNKLLGAAFGYPSTQANGDSTINYLPVVDVPYRRPEAPHEPLCCICLLEYFAVPQDARKVGEHYRRAAEAFKSVLGMSVALDLGDCNGWTDAQVADVLRAAYGSREAVIKAGESKEFLWWEWLYKRRHKILNLLSSTTTTP